MVMKLLKLCTWNLLSNQCRISRFFRVLFYSTETETETVTVTSSSSSKDTLYGRLLQFENPRVSIVPVLDQWVGEGRPAKQSYLEVLIRRLRKSKRFNHALEVSEWMSNKRYLDLLPGDVVIRLDLISKVNGLEQAEKYFSNIPITLRGLQVYGALLNCYAQEKSLEKAEAIMQKMTDLGFNRTSLPYNVMLKLYADMGKHEKLDSLMQEMEEEGITGNNFTFNTHLDAYAIASDIEGMEKLLMKMEADVTVDWNAYVVAANCYLRAGMVEKALPMVKKSERLVRGKMRRFAYEVLLTLYASMGNKDEVYRIWNLYKKIGKIYNMGCLSMISSLVKLDDLDGAEKIWEEWNKKTSFDYRIPNFLINAYCKKGLLGNAESIVIRLIESGIEPHARIWQRLAAGYHDDDQMEKAVGMMKKALTASHSRWKPNLPTLAACVEYLKGKGSIEVAEELIELLREKNVVPSEVCERLVNYIENGNPASGALDLIIGGDDQALKGERGMRVEVRESIS